MWSYADLRNSIELAANVGKDWRIGIAQLEAGATCGDALDKELRPGGQKGAVFDLILGRMA